MTRRLVLLDSHAPPEEVRCERCAWWQRGVDSFHVGMPRLDWGSCSELETVQPEDFGCADFEAKESE